MSQVVRPDLLLMGDDRQALERLLGTEGRETEASAARLQCWDDLGNGKTQVGWRKANTSAKHGGGTTATKNNGVLCALNPSESCE